MVKPVFYSVKEFSQLAGVSVQAVYKRLNGDLSTFVKQDEKNKRQKIISEQALRLFDKPVSTVENKVEKLNENTEKDPLFSTLLSTKEKTFTEVIQAKEEEISTLKEAIKLIQLRVETVEKQLDVKDEQIKDLSKRLAEAQSMAQSVAQANAVLASQAQQLQAIETQERQEQRRRRWFRRG